MPLDERNVLPPDNDGNEDVSTQSRNRYLPPRYQSGDDSPLPPDPPGREDIMAPDPRERRALR